MYTIILQANTGGFPLQLVMMGALIAVMYFFFIRPQAQKQKAQVNFEKELKKGDEVVTTSGIIGTITKIDDKQVTLQISQKGFLDVVVASISKEMTEAYHK
jgi:preprotein translocase subunit YajC